MLGFFLFYKKKVIGIRECYAFFFFAAFKRLSLLVFMSKLVKPKERVFLF